MMVRTVGEHILSVLSDLYEKNPDDFKNSIARRYGEDNVYVSSAKSLMRAPKRIPDTSYWLEGNLSLPQKIIIVFKLMVELNCNSNEIVDTIKNLSRNSQP